jgi:hypothetical protein
MKGQRSVRSRVGRLEGERRRSSGACRICGGAGYPGTFVTTGEGRRPEQVGSTSCAGCGRVRMGAVVVLPDAHEWARGEIGDER